MRPLVVYYHGGGWVVGDLDTHDGVCRFLAREMNWYTGHYLPDRTAARDPRASPLLAPDLSGLPPAVVLTAGFDPLRDEGEAYAKRLEEAGVRVWARRYPGLIHGFANTTSVSRVGCAAVLEGAELLRAAIASR